jgi:hypothetical protein
MKREKLSSIEGCFRLRYLLLRHYHLRVEIASL